jgi:glycosyltransferase involved in cell wall biosynthesis
MHLKGSMVNSLNDKTMDNNNISIVLAVHNGEKYIRKLFDSLIAQEDVIIQELIVVDDKSTDTSIEIIKTFQQKYPNIRLIANHENLGPIKSFIEGAKLTSSRYVAFADQDDIWKPTKLSLCLELLKKIEIDNKPSMVFSDLEMIDENDTHLYDSFWDLYRIRPVKNNLFTILFGNIVTGCTMIINRSMVNEFVEMPVTAPMHDHWIALIAYAFGNVAYLEDTTVLYRVHNNSVTNKHKVTFKQTIVNFLDASFGNKSKFLEDYINQAILFKLKYANKLNGPVNRQLNYFIRLKNASGFVRKLNSKFRFLPRNWA